MCLAVPGKLVGISGEDPLQRTGKVSFGGVLKDVSLACLPEAQVGDYVIVHVGMAISLLNEEEANETFRYLQQIETLGQQQCPTP
ncbi:MAG TPA: HypC/HybG/HupF family hydrogenase formation chaperone [Candidatus Methylomirabilis sp.]